MKAIKDYLNSKKTKTIYSQSEIDSIITDIVECLNHKFNIDEHLRDDIASFVLKEKLSSINDIIISIGKALNKMNIYILDDEYSNT